jgi:predicted nucleotidyltransferase
VVEGKAAAIEKFGLGPATIDMLREVFRRHYEVQRVKIFGSRAVGRFEDCSDVDLALWGNLSLGVIGRIAAELDELPLPYIFDVKAYESIKHAPLKRHIDQFGKILYDDQSNNKAHHL